jgi:hypothetical protein
VLKCHTFEIFNLFKYNIGFNSEQLNYQKDLYYLIVISVSAQTGGIDGIVG